MTCLLSRVSKLVLSPLPQASYSMSTRGALPGGESHHLSPSSDTQMKNVWTYTSIPLAGTNIFTIYTLLQSQN